MIIGDRRPPPIRNSMTAPPLATRVDRSWSDDSLEVGLDTACIRVKIVSRERVCSVGIWSRMLAISGGSSISSLRVMS